MEGGYQAFAADGFGDEAARPHFHDVRHIVPPVRPGEDDNGHIGIGAHHTLDPGDAVHSRHHQVEDDQIEIGFPRRDGDGFLEPRSLEHLDLGVQDVEKRAQGLADQGVVVG